MFGTRNRSPILPHLAYTENSTQLDFIFDHLEFDANFSNLRIAMEMSTIASERDNFFSLDVSRSLDDEYTPGVFKVNQILRNIK